MHKGWQKALILILRPLMPDRLKTPLLLCLFFALIGLQRAQGQSTDLVESLTEDWMLYDESESIFVPYLPSIHRNVQQLHLPLRLSDYEGFYLTVKAGGATHLWVNNRLIHAFDLESGESSITIKISEWKGYYEKGDTSMVTLYAQAQQPLQRPQAYVSQYPEQANLVERRGDVLRPKPKPEVSSRYTVTLLGVGVLAVFAVFYRLPNIFNMPYLSRYLAGFTKVKNEGNRIDSLGFLLFLIFYGLAIAYLFALLSPSVLSEAMKSEPEGLSWLLLKQFLQLFLWIQAFLAAKFLIIWLLTNLYDYRRALSIHVEEFMSIHQIYAIGALAMAGVLHFSNTLLSVGAEQAPQYAFWGSMLLGNVLVAYRINKNLPFRKVYLISYLCGTEFFPTLVLIRFLIIQ